MNKKINNTPASFITFILAPLFIVACNTSNVSSDQTSTSDTTKSTPSASSTSASIPTDSEVSSEVSSGVIHISNEQLQALMDKNITVVDIRRPEEWAETGIVAGSKKLTFFSKTGAINPKLVPELKKIAPTDKPVILICRTGTRTRIAAQMIQVQLGYETVYNVEHGITKWIAGGRKVAK
ncbi:MAG: rhodanese-like domain-containing protein [Thiotrichaceae bacterium]